MEQIKNSEFYLYVSAMEQILATTLISLRYRADQKWRVLSPGIDYGADFSHQPYLCEILSPCIGYGADFSHRPYLSEVAREQILSPCIGYGADFSHQLHLSEVVREQDKDTDLIFLKL
ncbi:UDP-3-O-[3-hydroxymyristoyl] N-acetylglucosamine deacetylase [Gossypium arboreum]|uniref:UDP-3-O-[3-hydroxymyristoyl] N-acetylglucosamine deacetylase n=1 Tax=Gossypium arboreum TaxID=29729 RepID=A0A0B0MXW9_GOSAR|nr:UDP-3-O-[3-hydroxymyristoyl] N-acetylglucosamine deacetylase [Gossypium arboreum]KHG18298.1 UDP-3-O-[3-hydroxymyristoyl] N-acetylglucosamine deacetylase [Gossypium arboreum]